MPHRHGDPSAQWGLLPFASLFYLMPPLRGSTFLISYILFDVAPMGLISFRFLILFDAAATGLNFFRMSYSMSPRWGSTFFISYVLFDVAPTGLNFSYFVYPIRCLIATATLRSDGANFFLPPNSYKPILIHRKSFYIL